MSKTAVDNTSKPLVLVDGSSYLFRAYHALPPLTNKEGMPTGAIYGVINMLKKLQTTIQPEHMAVVFDTKGKTFRHELYPDYKANRPEMPEELACQIEPLHEVIRAMGFPLIKQEGVEADDIIGALAKRAEALGVNVLISTGDKDFAQLINKHITLVNTMTDSILDENTVVDKFGVKASQIIDYLALVGDTVDNVPGVPKVGPKTAAKWLEQYGSLENLIEHKDEIKGKIGEYLRDSITLLGLSKQLVTIKTDIPLEFQPLELNLKAQDIESLKTWFTRLQFKTWLKQLEQGSEGAVANSIVRADPTSSSSTSSSTLAKSINRQYETVLDEESLKAWALNIKQHKIFAIDTETDNLDAHRANLVGVSLCVTPGTAAYIPVGHNYLGVPKQLPLETVLSYLRPLLLDHTLTKVGQNLKYDMHVFKNAGLSFDGPIEDTMMASYVINSTSRHDMSSLATNHLGLETISFEEVVGKGAKQKTFNEIEIEQATPYAAEDADITLRLYHHFKSILDEDEKLGFVYKEIECPMVGILAQVEQNGVKVDLELLAAQSVEIGVKLADLESKAHELAEEPFNLSSPKQLQAILFEKLKLPILKKTPTGQPSTAEDVLSDLAHQYELPSIILTHRSLSKLKSTYLDALPLQVNPKTGRIHTSYRQAVTATGRLSSSDPNLQNIPVRTDEGRRIRSAFIAEPGFVIVAADYSQIELHIMAHLCADPSLVYAFNHGEDIHRFTASQVFNLPLEAVTSEQRRRAKAINFGLIYGMSAYGLAAQLDIDRKDAALYMEQYFTRYPKVKEFMNATRDSAYHQGYVETLFGRKLTLPDIRSKNPMLRQGAERAAINAPMQGTAADIIKRAMILVDAWIKKDMQGKVIMTMQVHDELVFEVRKDAIDEAKHQIKTLMESAAQLHVPLTVEVGVGDSWDAAH